MRGDCTRPSFLHTVAGIKRAKVLLHLIKFQHTVYILFKSNATIFHFITQKEDAYHTHYTSHNKERKRDSEKGI